MKKIQVFCFSLLMTSFLTAQTLVNEPTSFWNVDKTLVFIENDQEVISVPNNFTYNHQLKKRTKLMTIDGELHHIVREKKEQLVYKKGGELVAKINRKNGSIHLLESGKIYKKKYRPFNSSHYYLNENGEKVVSAKHLIRDYKISTKLESFPGQRLLMALNLHQFLEIQYQISGLTDILLLTSI